jgi:hypothetical protein
MALQVCSLGRAIPWAWYVALCYDPEPVAVGGVAGYGGGRPCAGLF